MTSGLCSKPIPDFSDGILRCWHRFLLSMEAQRGSHSRPGLHRRRVCQSLPFPSLSLGGESHWSHCPALPSHMTPRGRAYGTFKRRVKGSCMRVFYTSEFCSALSVLEPSGVCMWPGGSSWLCLHQRGCSSLASGCVTRRQGPLFMKGQHLVPSFQPGLACVALIRKCGQPLHWSWSLLPHRAGSVSLERGGQQQGRLGGELSPSQALRTRMPSWSPPLARSSQ